jgi:prepilin-type N-terminal cleavage/methylation domain-containing protein
MNVPRPRLRAALHLGRGAERGFTLVEMLAVIAMIGILTVVASPIFIDMMRDRRINRAAMNIADYYRTARSRALGRGMPVLIRWDANAGLKQQSSGVLSILEPVVLDYPSVNTSCVAIDWTDTNVAYTYSQFDVGDGHYERADVSFIDDTGATRAKADVCFSPRGRTYLRTTGVFTELTGVPTFKVVNSKAAGGTGLVRTVFIPPNGVARLAQ